MEMNKIRKQYGYMGKCPDLNKVDLDKLELFNLEIPEQDISILNENKFSNARTDWNNPSDVLKVCENIFNSDKDEKEKLYILGIILTHNKNEYIKGLKQEFYYLQQKIKRQRVYINKLIGNYDGLRYCHKNLSKKYMKIKNNSNSNKSYSYNSNFNKNRSNEDEIAWKKANDEYNKRFNNVYSSPTNEPPKKKIVIVKKKPLQNN